MTSLYTISASDDYRYIVLRNVNVLASLGPFNSRLLEERWPGFICDSMGSTINSLPEVSILNTGALMVDSRHLSKIQGCLPGDIEILSATVDGDPWHVINCLAAVEEFDTSRSNILSDGEGNIFFILDLKIPEKLVVNKKIFTLRKSNRSQIIATDQFVECVAQSGIRGLQFRKVGSCTSD